MPDNEEILFSGIVDFEAKGVDDVLADAARVEAAISGLDATANLDVTVDQSQLDNAITAINGIDGLTPSVDIGTSLETADLTTLSDLEAAIYSPTIDPDLAEASALATLEAVDTAVYKPEIDPKETNQGKEVLDRLDQIRNLQIIEIALNVAGNLPGILGKLEEFTVAPILETQNAIAGLDARTRGALPNVEALINGLNAEGLGESRDAIASVLEEGIRLDIPEDQFADAARGALQVTEVFTDQDPVEVLSRMNDLVESGLAPNFKSAADLITTGFQEFGTSLDFAGVIQEYQADFRDLGVTGEQALSLIKTGLKSGFPTPDAVIDALREFQNLTNEAAGDSENDASKALAQLGLQNPAELGEQVGVDFIQSVIAGIKANPEGEFTQQQLVSVLFGSKGEDLGAESILGLDANTNAFSGLTGAAEEAATAINDTLTQQLDIFFRYVEQEAVNFLSSDAIDLDGKIQAIKTGLSDAIAVLQDGGSLEEAITVGLKPIGFDDEFQKIESVFGNFIIQFLEVVAGIQDILGKDSSGTRAEVARLGQQQLEFDLQLTNPEDITDAIQTARERGVTDDAIGQIVTTAVGDALANQDVAQAQNIVTGAGATTQIVTGADQLGAFGGLAGAINPALNIGVEVPVDLGIDAGSLQEQIDMAKGDLQEQLDAALAAGDLNVAIPLAAQLGDTELLAQLEALKTQYTNEFDAALGRGQIASAIETAGYLEDEDINARIQEYVNSQFGSRPDTSGKGTNDSASSRFEEVVEAVDAAATDIATSSDAMASSVEDADSRIGDATTGNTMTANFDELTDVVLMDTDLMGEAIESFAVSVEEVDDKIASLLANMGAAFASLSGDIASSVVNFQGQVGSSTTLNVNQTINTTSGAQAAAAANLTVDGLRGFAP